MKKQVKEIHPAIFFGLAFGVFMLTQVIGALNFALRDLNFWWMWGLNIFNWTIFFLFVCWVSDKI